MDKYTKLQEVKDQIDAGFDRLNERQDSTDKWVSEIEAKVNTSRFGGPGVNGGRDRLIAGIPPEYRKHIMAAEIAGHGDPVQKAALGTWWSLMIKARLAPFSQDRNPPGFYYEKADALERAWGFDPVLKGAVSESTGGGGSIIATPVEAELWRVIRDNTIVRPLATKILMSALTHQVPGENANVTATITAEAGTISDSLASTAFAQQALTAKKFTGLATVSNELLQDNIIGLTEYLFTAIGEGIGILEDQGALDGTNFTGVAVASGVNSATVSGTATSGGNIPTYTDLVSLAYLAAQASTRKNAAFFCLPAVTKNAISLVDTTGQPILKFADAVNQWQGRILGYPVYEVSSLSTAQTTMTTSTNIYFGPPNKILYGDLSGMQFDLDPYGLFTTVQTRVRVVKRTAILVPKGAFFSFMKGVRYS